MEEVNDIILFFGRFHPLVVHLPIGFLLFAFILEVFSRWKKNPVLTTAVPLALFLGAISALMACILGYMLSLSGDYEQGALDVHFWFGVGTTVIASLAWLISAKKIPVPKLRQDKPYMTTLTLIVVLLGVTGHYGGNLTHGSDYLTAYLPFGKKEKKELAPIASVEEAQVFDYLVNPILEDKCLSCHNSSKKKGQLSFADMEAILKGGKTGPALVAGDASKSEMIRRVLLDEDDEELMPPDGKTPLTKKEVAIIDFWIQQGNGSFEHKMGDIEVSEDIRSIASVMLGFDPDTTKETLVAGPVVDESALNEIKASGFKVRELVVGSNLFDVSLTGVRPGMTNERITEMIGQLTKIKNNIIWLSLPENKVKDEDLKIIASFEKLKRLRLEKNPVTDIGVSYLSSLQNLESLNLYQTKITNKSLEAFSRMQKLKRVYIWGTEVKKDQLSKTDVDTSILDLIL